ncbi:unnamed protein product [Knipowitschia caucasica]
MGNSNQKRKRLQAEKILIASPKSCKDNQKELWLFGRPDKLNTAGPKGKDEQKKLTVHYTACRQENVFIEGSRPQHLEDLHTEALEGLKIQQEENRNGVENTHAVSFPDDESVTSTITLQQEQNISSKDEDGCSESRSPTGNTDTSDFSAGSTRPGLICQGSTFKPLHPVKSIDRNKKRSRRTTIMGIPHQVQKELALRRHSTFQQLPENNNTSSNQSGVVVIPTVDGGTPVSNGEGARVHLSELEQVSREESILVEQLQAMYQNKLHFSFQGFGHHTGPTTMRPKSVAVPGMTASLSSPASMLSFLQEPQGPVMSISPQATYLSTIIPNAILPISVDVIEIDHSLHRTRGSSVHAVSKSSLESGESPASPLLYRRSDKPSSHFDTYQNNSSTPPASESQSSKTIVLVSSPTSSKRSTGSADSHRLSVSEQGNQRDHTGEDLVSTHSSVSMMSCPTSTSEHLVVGDGFEIDISQVEDNKIKRRSLSVTKTKQPPAPPRRTNSLHSSKIRNNSKVVGICQETVLANDVCTTDSCRRTITLSTPNSVLESGGAQPKSDASFLHRDKMERTISPSSGYSSQSGTPTMSPKEFSPISPEKQKKLPVKPERSISRASTSAACPSSPSSSLTSLSSSASETVLQDVPSKNSTTSQAISSTLAMEIKGLTNIPPYPEVRAPCPPPPEVWTQNRQTVDLLLGSYRNVPLSQPLDDARTLKETQTEENEPSVDDIIVVDEVESIEENKRDVEVQNMIVFGEEVLITQENFGDIPVVRVTLTDDQHLAKPVDEEPKASESCIASSENHSDIKVNGHSSFDTLTIEMPKYPKDSPPHTPPPTYQPTPPLSRKPLPKISTIPQKIEESKVSESCWPPPPPPLEEAYEGGDEADFPLSPPPLLLENHIDTSNKVEIKDLISLTKEVLPGQEQDTPLVLASEKDVLAPTVNTKDSSASLISNSSRQDSFKAEEPIHVVSAQAIESKPSVNFRRQPSTTIRAKESQARYKSMPMPKEDANIPLVTPSLLQMVRLRSVSMAEEVDAPSEEKDVETSEQESCPIAIQTSQNVPQKPIRKSLSIKLPSTTTVQPSLRLQEAIRVKTAAMSTKESLLSRPLTRLPPYSSIGEPLSDIHKSAASTASFIFSRSHKKVVIETVGPCAEAQQALKQNLASELLDLSGQSNSNSYNGGIKSIPPPVARKPSLDGVGPLQARPGNIGVKHQIAPLETKTTRVTADTIETLF